MRCVCDAAAARRWVPLSSAPPGPSVHLLRPSREARRLPCQRTARTCLRWAERVRANARTGATALFLPESPPCMPNKARARTDAGAGSTAKQPCSLAASLPRSPALRRGEGARLLASERVHRAGWLLKAYGSGPHLAWRRKWVRPPCTGRIARSFASSNAKPSTLWHVPGCWPVSACPAPGGCSRRAAAGRSRPGVASRRAVQHRTPCWGSWRSLCRAVSSP